ncbi:DUF192 domain-containing protein [Chromatiaceae bacterium AAb-1]|nr:DUF192 domain-containing protein [Chromatiaceae bacterium AAb-1]
MMTQHLMKQSIGLLAAIVLLLAVPAIAEDMPLQQFELVGLQLGDKHIQVQLADDFPKRAQGLMFKDTAEPGMLLLYPRAQIISLWMANTTIDLDVAFIGKDWKIQKITRLYSLDETPVPSPAKAIAALEMPQGWFKQQGITEGTKVTLLEQKN